MDSVVSYRLTVGGHGTGTLRVWMAAHENMEEAAALQAALLRQGFDETLAATAAHWQALALRSRPDLDRLTPRAAELFTRSLLLIRTQVDRRGAILASNDSDIMETARAHYSYMWPRDGALVSYALDRVGQRDMTRPFFEFCARVLPPDRAALMHKYGPDGTVGASWHPWIVDGQPEIPFQEDGTALVVWALRQHHLQYGDRDFLAAMYRRLARPAAEFMAGFRDPRTRLPCRRGTSGRSAGARTSGPSPPSPPPSPPPPRSPACSTTPSAPTPSRRHPARSKTPCWNTSGTKRRAASPA